MSWTDGPTVEQFDLLTFLDQLSPSLGPLSELLTVGLLDLGTFLKAVHEIIAESMAIVSSLHGTFVVPHLWRRGEGDIRKRLEAGDHRNVPKMPYKELSFLIALFSDRWSKWLRVWSSEGWDVHEIWFYTYLEYSRVPQGFLGGLMIIAF